MSAWTRLAMLAAFAVLLAASPPARAEDVNAVARTARDAEDPVERQAAVEELGRIGTEFAARELLHAATYDADPQVRVAAARALGDIPGERATDLLAELVAFGGTRAVRWHAAHAFGKRPHALDRIRAHIAAKDAPQIERELWVEVLGAQPSLDAAVELEHLARDPSPRLRTAALRALACHPAGAAELPALLADVLSKFGDRETVLGALDVADDVPDADLRPLAKALLAMNDPDVTAAVDLMVARLDRADAVVRRAKEAKDGYGDSSSAAGGPEPLPPQRRQRIDVIYGFDATGSVWGYLDQIRKWIWDDEKTLKRVGASLRVGVMVFRDADQDREPDLFPLTYDCGAVDEFLAGIRTHGAEEPGVGHALASAFDRSSWRWTARCDVCLVVDGKIQDSDRARAEIAVHLKADGAKSSLWYIQRTRGEVPESLRALARAGGGELRILDELDARNPAPR